MTSNDYYKILGVSKGDPKESIKKAYKKLAMKYHPDRAPDDKKDEYEKKFKEINEAYSVLGDEKKKQEYDLYGHDSFNHGGYRQQKNTFHGEDISDIFRDIFENNFFGNGGNGNYKKQTRGDDLQYELSIDFKEAIFGCEKKIEIRKNVLCKKCEGTGARNKEQEKCNECEGMGVKTISRRTPFGVLRQKIICEECNGEGVVSKQKCGDCHGKGVVNKTIKIKIKIPEGINDKQILRISEEGDAIKNGKNGDLLLFINVHPHKIFKREGDDIYMDFPITFSQAALGDKIIIPTLKGNTKIKIASGIESGTVLRLKGKGARDINGFRIGDQFVNIKIKTPTKLNKKQKTLFKELSKLE